VKSAVAFLVFNRPGCTRRVFERIRDAKPPVLLVVADGPRAERADDAQKCAEVRSIIEQGIDWPCVVRQNYSEQNLGCAKRVSSGLDWAFSIEERLIVLEDDCLPDPSFFQFCDEMLERYQAVRTVGQICGCLRYFSKIDRKSDYVFTRYGPVWGWASWRRAWATYDIGLRDWPRHRAAGTLRAVTSTRRELRARTALYDNLHNKPVTTWDYQWGYAKLVNGLLSVMPTVNLIENIGFDGQGTHYTSGEFGLRVHEMTFPLCHPAEVSVDANFDLQYARAFAGRGLLHRIYSKLSRVLSREFKND
jgi:hypothetical protein